MSFFGWGKTTGGNAGGGTGTAGLGAEQPGHNLQDGLFQIASQACHILVQVSRRYNQNIFFPILVDYDERSKFGKPRDLFTVSLRLCIHWV